MREWIRKAEANYHVALRELRVTVHPSPDAVCFHAQQCVEKYLKAILFENHRPAPKIHNLETLWPLCTICSTRLQRKIKGLDVLTSAAVEFRYPGVRATAPQARRAVLTMQRARKLARSVLGLR